MLFRSLKHSEEPHARACCWCAVKANKVLVSVDCMVEFGPPALREGATQPAGLATTPLATASGRAATLAILAPDRMCRDVRGSKFGDTTHNRDRCVGGGWKGKGREAACAAAAGIEDAGSSRTCLAIPRSQNEEKMDLDSFPHITPGERRPR